MSAPVILYGPGGGIEGYLYTTDALAIALADALARAQPASLATVVRTATTAELTALGAAVAVLERRRHAMRWVSDPTGWCEHHIPGLVLAPYQAQALTRLGAERRLALRSVHGAGKTTVAALAVLWFAASREAAGLSWKVPTTASVWRQLAHYLWPEIHAWSARVRWEDAGLGTPGPARLMRTRLRLEHGEAWAMSVAEPAHLEGTHAAHVLVVVDEAKTVPSPVWDALEGAGSSGDVWSLAVSTPGPPSGRYYELFARPLGWARMHVTMAEAVAAGRVSAEWAERVRQVWGQGSAVYRSRVLGEFAADSADGVCVLEDVESAQARWERPDGPLTAVGVDVGRTTDATVVAPLHGRVVGQLVTCHGDTGRTVAAVLAVAGREQRGPTIVVDADGIGAGVYDALRDLLGRRVVAFHGAGSPGRWRDRSGALEALNARAAAWWHVRDLLATGELDLPPDDDELVGDLTETRWRHSTAGRLAVEHKDDLRSRLGRSTDRGDAVVMACWATVARAGGATANAALLGRSLRTGP